MLYMTAVHVNTCMLCTCRRYCIIYKYAYSKYLPVNYLLLPCPSLSIIPNNDLLEANKASCYEQNGFSLLSNKTITKVNKSFQCPPAGRNACNAEATSAFLFTCRLC